jgi:AcrR family transcriptional regulator
MGTRERRDRERGEIRTLIMDTARRLFASEGYDAVSMRRIADAIEYSPTAIYVYFKDKVSLIRELCVEDFGKLAAECVKLARVKDPIDRIRQLGHVYIRFAVEHPNHYRLMFMTPMEATGSMGKAEPVEAIPEKPESKGNPEQDAYAFLLHAVTEALLARRFAPKHKDPKLLAQTFWAVVHGVASLEIVMGKDCWIDWASLQERASAAIEVAIRGMDCPRGAMERKPKPKVGDS